MFVHGFFKDEPSKLRLLLDDEPEQIILKTIDAIAAYVLQHLATKAA